jgi:hypothetical protein
MCVVASDSAPIVQNEKKNSMTTHRLFNVNFEKKIAHTLNSKNICMRHKMCETRKKEMDSILLAKMFLFCKGGACKKIS